jgi:hypothetical protein
MKSENDPKSLSMFLILYFRRTQDSFRNGWPGARAKFGRSTTTGEPGAYVEDVPGMGAV